MRSSGAAHCTSTRWLGHVTDHLRCGTARGPARRVLRTGSGCAAGSAFFFSFSSSDRTALAIAAATSSVDEGGLGWLGWFPWFCRRRRLRRVGRRFGLRLSNNPVRRPARIGGLRRRRMRLLCRGPHWATTQHNDQNHQGSTRHGQCRSARGAALAERDELSGRTISENIDLFPFLLRLTTCRPDGLEQIRHAGARRLVLGLRSRRHRAARLVTHHHEQRNVKLLSAVLHRRKDRSVDHFSRRTDDEDIAKAGVEHVLRRNARIDARQHHRERMLSRGQFLAPVDAQRYRRRGVSLEAMVPRLQQPEGLLRAMSLPRAFGPRGYQSRAQNHRSGGRYSKSDSHRHSRRRHTSLEIDLAHETLNCARICTLGSLV